MDFKRAFLYFVLAILGVMLWHAWTLDHAHKPLPMNTIADGNQIAQVAQHPAEYTPSSYSASEPSRYHASAKRLSKILPEGKIISIKTNVLDAQINLRGGNLVTAKLVKYPVSLQKKHTPIQILNKKNSELYIAQSGLSVALPHQTRSIIDYQTAKRSYTLGDGRKTLVVTLKGKTAQGIEVQKIFTFTRGEYRIGTDIRLINHTQSEWKGNLFNQITHRYVPNGGSFYSRSYIGGAMYTQDTPYKKLTFEHMAENNLSKDVNSGWIAMQQHYFLSAWVPEKGKTMHYYSRSFGDGDDGKNNIFILGYMSPMIHLKAGASTTFNSALYIGPEISKNLKSMAKGLDLTIDYGWLWPISKFLFWVMSYIDSVVGNWGWTIILVTLLIKGAFYWLSNKSYVSMAKTRDLQPKMKALKERHGDDKQAMSKAMMELYRKEKINPVGGCLPMVIQIPVFIALYYVLIESVQLRQAPFIFWIHDLSVKDPYFILPILMGLTMLLQQKISPPPPDPMQAKMMMLLPVVFTVFFATFPAGLVLYWLTNSCASVLQQWYVMKTYKAPRKTRKKRNK